MSPRVFIYVAIVVGMVGSGNVHAQSSCATELERASTMLAQGEEKECFALLDTLLMTSCAKDRELKHRLLLLKAATYHPVDSVDQLRGTLETMFRNNRRMVIRPYDKDIKDKPWVWDTWNDLVRPELQQDAGWLRAGLFVGPLMPILDVNGTRKVLDSDEDFRYSPATGYEAGVTAEVDILKNTSVGVSAALARSGYTVRNNAIRYEEELTQVPLRLTAKHRIGFGPLSPWHAFVGLSAAWVPLISADASIERSGDGVRFLSAKTLDRKAERRPWMATAGGSIGIGRKVGHCILIVQARYDHALQPLMREEPAYTETELLARYYFVDNEVSFSSFSASFGVQYIIRYHAKNRIHP